MASTYFVTDYHGDFQLTVLPDGVTTIMLGTKSYLFGSLFEATRFFEIGHLVNHPGFQLTATRHHVLELLDEAAAELG